MTVRKYFASTDNGCACADCAERWGRPWDEPGDRERRAAFEACEADARARRARA